jgi:hypothetical protein
MIGRLMRFLIADVKLCLFPPRLIEFRIGLVQLSTVSHANTSCGRETTLLRSSVRCVAHADLADLGIFLMLGMETGVKEVAAASWEIPELLEAEGGVQEICE